MKMYCIFSMEAVKAMGGNRGKLAAMSGHAFLHAYWDSETANQIWAAEYRRSGLAKKVALSVKTTEELTKLFEKFSGGKFGKTLVIDAARTVFDGPTVVCIGIGPVPDDWGHEAIRDLGVML